MSFTVPFHIKEKKEIAYEVGEGQRMGDLSPGSPPGGITNWIPEQQLLKMKDLSLSSPSAAHLGGEVVARPQLTLRSRPVHIKGKGKGLSDEQTSTLPENEAAYLSYEMTFDPCEPFQLTSVNGKSFFPTGHRLSSKIVEAPYHVFCTKCYSEHHPDSYCPVLPCKTCYNPHHSEAWCPFFEHIPKGAVFDRANYEIICECHYAFDEDKWVCVRCDGTSLKLQRKYCKICKECTQHLSHECPKDKVRAAQYQAIRDQELSFKKIPYVG